MDDLEITEGVQRLSPVLRSAGILRALGGRWLASMLGEDDSRIEHLRSIARGEPALGLPRLDGQVR